MREAKRVFALDLSDNKTLLERLSYVNSPDDCLDSADALVILTEWKVFKSPDFELLRSRLKASILFDGRNLFAPRLMVEEGFEYHSIGRPTRKEASRVAV